MKDRQASRRDIVAQQLEKDLEAYCNEDAAPGLQLLQSARRGRAAHQGRRDSDRRIRTAAMPAQIFLP